MNGYAWFFAALSAVLAVQVLYLLRLYRRAFRAHVRREIQRRIDVDRVPGEGLTDKRRAWMLARIARGDSLGDIYAEDWEPLP